MAFDSKDNDGSKQLVYNVADSVLESFHASKSIVRGIRSARGTGKSLACQMELYLRALSMPPQKDGVRRSRFLITRTVYQDLYETAVKTYISRFSNVYGMLPIAGGGPWTGGIKMKLSDGTTVESEWLFKAFDDDSLSKLTSAELTAGYVNEFMDYQSVEIINAVLASCARFPSFDNFPKKTIEDAAKRGESVYQGFVIWDTNGPPEQHFLRKLEDEPPSTWEFFVQESPLLIVKDLGPHHTQFVTWQGKNYIPNPKAEFASIQQKGYGYWLDLVPGSPQHFIESKILGGYSKSVAGQVVYSEFDEQEHISKSVISVDLAATKRIVCGIDTSGAHPACVWTVLNAGTLYVLEECGAQDIAFEQFVEEYVLPIHNANYSSNEVIYVCDPSNPQSGIDKRTAMSVLLKAGLRAELARTNKFGDRRDAVKKFLNRRNGFVSSSANEVLNSGFRGHYRYDQVRGKAGIFKEAPNKDVIQADYHDALQYACLKYVGYNEQPQDKRRLGVTAKRAI